MINNGLRIFIATCVLIAAWTVLGKARFFRDPGSIFFDARHAYQQQYSKERLASATIFRDHTVTPERPFTRASASSQLDSRLALQICIGIPTVQRQGLTSQYIPSAIASILEGLSLQERAMTNISVFFADANYPSHPDWGAPWVSSLSDDVWAFKESTFSPETQQYLAEMEYTNLKSRNKGTIDYTLSLERCLHTDARYIAVFEEDIVLARGWLAPTLLALRDADHVVKQNSEVDDWLFTRLFTQERSIGWIGHRVGENHELKIALLVDAVILCLGWLARRRRTLSLDNAAIAVICIFTAPSIIIMFFQSGKGNLLPPSDGLLIQTHGCCSQALIFNRQQVPGLIQYLRDYARLENGDEPHVNYDLLTKFYGKINRLALLALYPMQAQHVGLKSSIGTNSTEAQAVWSMAFEDLSAEKVARRHADAMTVLFGTNWSIGQP